MFVCESSQKNRSEPALRVLIIAFFMTVILCICDGILKGYFVHHAAEQISYETYAVWINDFRIFGDQIIFTAAVFFIGMKFLETRTTLTIGFDKVDGDKISFKGPDENNIIWIGRRYDSRLEAEAVAAAVETHMQQSNRV